MGAVWWCKLPQVLCFGVRCSDVALLSPFSVHRGYGIWFRVVSAPFPPISARLLTHVSTSVALMQEALMISLRFC